MLRILVFFCSLLLAFNADAIVKQKASKALSFKNVANDDRGKNRPVSTSVRGGLSLEKNLEHHIEPPATETVDLRISDTASVRLKASDTLVIQLNEPEGGFSWDIKTLGTGLSRVSSSVDAGVQTIIYRLKATKSSDVFIDYVNTTTNEIAETKMLTIRLR